MVEDVSVCLHVGAVFDVDGEAISDPDQGLVDRRGCVATAFDGDLVPDAQLALLDPGYLVSRGVLQHKGLPEAKRLAVDLVPALALVVLDPEVIADRKQPFAHEKPLALALIVISPQETDARTVRRLGRRAITPMG